MSHPLLCRVRRRLGPSGRPLVSKNKCVPAPTAPPAPCPTAASSRATATAITAGSRTRRRALVPPPRCWDNASSEGSFDEMHPSDSVLVDVLGEEWVAPQRPRHRGPAGASRRVRGRATATPPALVRLVASVGRARRGRAEPARPLHARSGVELAPRRRELDDEHGAADELHERRYASAAPRNESGRCIATRRQLS